MKLNASEIKNILVISLSNIGDVILTFPVIDVLKRDFPSAPLSVVVGPKAKRLLEDNPHIKEVLIFDKRQGPFAQLRWILKLRQEKFDLVVDLRNTAIPFLVSSKYRTLLAIGEQKNIHMKEKHLSRLKVIHDFGDEPIERFALFINREEAVYIENLLKPHVGAEEKFIVVGPGAANHLKRWRSDSFAEVCDELIKRYKIKIVLVGDKNDEQTVRAVVKEMKNKPLDLCGKTDLKQLAALLKSAVLVIANDSGIMHMASYLNVPTIAIFGPTNPIKYGPWGKNSHLVKNTAVCTACEKPNRQHAHQCMDDIHPQEVLNTVKAAMES